MKKSIAWALIAGALSLNHYSFAAEAEAEFGAEAPGTPKIKFDRVSSGQKKEFLRNARFWKFDNIDQWKKWLQKELDGDTEKPGYSVLDGYGDKDGFKYLEDVSCHYVSESEHEKRSKKKTTGKTPKFYCELKKDSGDEFKVKYKSGNGELYSTIAGTGLAHWMGFGHPDAYPIHINFIGNPSGAPSKSELSPFVTAVLDPGGNSIKDTDGFDGWSPKEFQNIGSGVSNIKAERDAFLIFWALVNHADHKDDNQELVCPKKYVSCETGSGAFDDVTKASGKVVRQCHKPICTRPLAMIHDFGALFSEPGLFIGDNKFQLEKWRKVPVFKKSDGRCEIKVSKGTPDGTEVSEAGRKLILEILTTLQGTKDRDNNPILRAIFVRAQSHVRGGSADQWLSALDDKISEIRSARCR